MGRRSSGYEACYEVWGHIGPDAGATRWREAATWGGTENIECTESFKTMIENAKGDRINLKVRRGRLPFECDHSQTCPANGVSL